MSDQKVVAVLRIDPDVSFNTCTAGVECVEKRDISKIIVVTVAGDWLNVSSEGII